MTSEGSASVSQWIVGLQRGEDQAVQRLWERYFARLMGLARKKLADLPRRVADEEDVALSALASFCEAARAGRFPSLTDRDGLWPLLVKFTANKALDRMRHSLRKKRGGGMVQGESAFEADGDSKDRQGLAGFIGDDPTPEFAAMVAEEFQRLLGLLDEDLRAIALLKMEGYTNLEVAARRGVPVVRVERSLRLIRATWKAAKEEYNDE